MYNVVYTAGMLSVWRWALHYTDTTSCVACVPDHYAHHHTHTPHQQSTGVQLQSTVDIADEQPTNSHSPPPTTTTALMPAISIPALPSTHLDNTLPALPSLLDNNSSGASSAAVSPMAAEGPEREPQVVGGTDMRVVADGGQHTVAWNGVEHQQEGGGEGDDEGDDMMQ